MTRIHGSAPPPPPLLRGGGILRPALRAGPFLFRSTLQFRRQTSYNSSKAAALSGSIATARCQHDDTRQRRVIRETYPPNSQTRPANAGRKTVARCRRTRVAARVGNAKIPQLCLRLYRDPLARSSLKWIPRIRSGRVAVYAIDREWVGAERPGSSTGLLDSALLELPVLRGWGGR